MKRCGAWAFFIIVSLAHLLEGAAAQLAHEAELSTPGYWNRVRAEDRALGFHANADDVAFHDTEAGMWEDGGE